MDNLNLELLSGLLGKPAGEITEALKKEDGEPKTISDILQWINESIDAPIKDRIKAARSDGHKEALGRAKREALSEAEKSLTEKYGLEGVEGGLDEIVTAIVQKHSNAKKTDPESIRNSEVYINDIKSAKAEAKQISDQFEAYKNEVKQNAILTKLREVVTSTLKDDNFALPENEIIRKNQMDAFISQFSSKYKFELDEENLVPLDQNGNPVRDDSYATLDIKGLTTLVGSQFFIKNQGDNRKGTGATTLPPASGSVTPENLMLPKIASHEDFYEGLKKLKSPEEMDAFKEQYKSLIEQGKLN